MMKLHMYKLIIFITFIIFSFICVTVPVIIQAIQREPVDSALQYPSSSETATVPNAKIKIHLVDAEKMEGKYQGDSDFKLQSKFIQSEEDIKSLIKSMISEEINKGQTHFEQILTADLETPKKVAEKCEHHENSLHKAKPIENSMSIKFKKAVEETRNVQRKVVDLMENLRNDTKSINIKTEEVEKEVGKITSLIMELSEFIEATDKNVQKPTLPKDIDRTEKGNHIPLQKKTERENIQFELLYIVLTLLFLVSCLNVIVLLCLFNKFVKNTAVLEHGPEKTKTSVSTNPDHVEKLEDSLCIVSFDESSSRTNHLSMTKKIAEYGELKLQTKRVVINKDSLGDLKDSIPPSKVFLVYIDYNEGNVILDKSECGTRRQTVKYLMKTNALVFIVYCLEKTSENLEELYAQKLTTIKTDPVLVDLSKRDRVFSIYKTFSKKQMEVIIHGIN